MMFLDIVDMVKNFLGNYRTKNYKLVEKLLTNLQDINMSIKVHFLHSHLDKFLDNWGDVLVGLDIVKIVFLNKQVEICWFKYKLRGFYNFTRRNIAIGQHQIYRRKKMNKEKKKVFQ